MKANFFKIVAITCLLAPWTGLAQNTTLLTTFTMPTPATEDLFGSSVAAVGSDRVLIGTPRDDTGATDAGAAYLFMIQPSLTIGLTTTNTVVVSWLSPWTDFTLQQNTNGLATGDWSIVTDTIQDDGVTRTLIVDPPTDTRFYRLFKP